MKVYFGVNLLLQGKNIGVLILIIMNPLIVPSVTVRLRANNIETRKKPTIMIGIIRSR